MFKAILVAVAIVAAMACDEACTNNGQCTAPCPRCTGTFGQSGLCKAGYSCNSVCVVNTDCGSDSCSVCAPVGKAYPGEYLCIQACNQTCSTRADCQGTYNFGCGNCIGNVCAKGKYCFESCTSDDECGTFDNPTCSKCIAGKCTAGCGDTCTFSGMCGNSTCARCANGTCGASQGCGSACVVNGDCIGNANNCTQCLGGKCGV